MLPGVGLFVRVHNFACASCKSKIIRNIHVREVTGKPPRGTAAYRSKAKHRMLMFNVVLRQGSSYFDAPARRRFQRYNSGPVTPSGSRDVTATASGRRPLTSRLEPLENETRPNHWSELAGGITPIPPRAPAELTHEPTPASSRPHSLPSHAMQPWSPNWSIRRIECWVIPRCEMRPIPTVPLSLADPYRPPPRVCCVAVALRTALRWAGRLACKRSPWRRAPQSRRWPRAHYGAMLPKGRRWPRAHHGVVLPKVGGGLALTTAPCSPK
jgi:hypothetical protein